MEEHYAQKDLARHNQRDVTLITSAESGTLSSLYGIDVSLHIYTIQST